MLLLRSLGSRMMWSNNIISSRLANKMRKKNKINLWFLWKILILLFTRCECQSSPHTRAAIKPGDEREKCSLVGQSNSEVERRCRNQINDRFCSFRIRQFFFLLTEYCVLSNTFGQKKESLAKEIWNIPAVQEKRWKASAQASNVATFFATIKNSISSSE